MDNRYVMYGSFVAMNLMNNSPILLQLVDIAIILLVL